MSRENLNKDKISDSIYYSVLKKADPEVNSMDLLRKLFPDGAANDLNFVLFSTSGIHGTYNTIEESEKSINGEKMDDGEDYCSEVTFLVVHPRIVCLRYGTVYPENLDDIEFLKKLRSSSHESISKIGF